MPINGLSEEVRMPRLGKIHLGYKNERGLPVKTDYFVFPKDHSDYKKLVEIFGEKPKELRILIPVEDAELWATQYYKAYSQTRGLLCKGNGETATRMVDIKTGDLPVKETETVTMKEIACEGKECPEYKARKCSEVMNLRFMLPEIPGLGVWQIDTGSINSILNINSCAKVIKASFGRITLVPLILSLEPGKGKREKDGKQSTIYVLNLRTNVTLAQLADLARESARTIMLAAPDLEAEYDRQVNADIEALWGDETKQVTAPTAPDKPEVKTEPPPVIINTATEPLCVKTEQPPKTESKTAPTKTESAKQASSSTAVPVDLSTLEFKNPGEFYAACFKYFKWAIPTMADIDKEIGMFDLTVAGQRQQAWLQIVGTYNTKKVEAK